MVIDGEWIKKIGVEKIEEVERKIIVVDAETEEEMEENIEKIEEIVVEIDVETAENVEEN